MENATPKNIQYRQDELRAIVPNLPENAHAQITWSDGRTFLMVFQGKSAGFKLEVPDAQGSGITVITYTSDLEPHCVMYAKSLEDCASGISMPPELEGKEAEIFGKFIDALVEQGVA